MTAMVNNSESSLFVGPGAPESLMDGLGKAYLSGEHGPALASPYLGRSKIIYEFIRTDLGVRTHGLRT
ncbi:hypothetical protein AX14_011832 [Amanita brunnescens Koide BX004]|nr:hypothetical protein AX14_011832 [Amanita brunnescens Koide BX004]